MKTLLFALVLLLASTAIASSVTDTRQVATGWWGGWEFGTTVHLRQPTLPGAVIVVDGISNDECMQAVVDGHNLPFHMVYQHKSPDGFQCQERWCLWDPRPTRHVQVFGSALWFGIRHGVAVTEFVSGSCP